MITGNSEKLFCKIGDVAKMFDVKTSLIRFWEKEFAIIKPKKSKSGRRLFTKKDVQNFHLIYHLVKEKGFTLEGAKKKLKQQPNLLNRDIKIISCLKNTRKYLLDIDKELENIQFANSNNRN